MLEIDIKWIKKKREKFNIKIESWIQSLKNTIKPFRPKLSKERVKKSLEEYS
jgi:hypothetical protein